VRRRVILAALLAVATGLAGCTAGRAGYNAVALGMTQDHVREILGAPRYAFADEWVYTGDNPRDLTLLAVRFKGGKVIAKSWQNPEKPEEDNRQGQATP
jgi:outer membrane protein assembly factor BamE (lipoprotein component of BamABCDE complex)